jgi:hypothetical protein
MNELSHVRVMAMAERLRQGPRGYPFIYRTLDGRNMDIMTAAACRHITSSEAVDLLMIVRASWWRRLCWRFS